MPTVNINALAKELEKLLISKKRIPRKSKPKPKPKPKGSKEINLLTIMITALASYDQERAAQANWLNAACPICLSRGCVQYRKRKNNMHVLEHK